MQEDERTELKKYTSELKEAIISIVAILNKHGKGKIYFGIKDDGQVIGHPTVSKLELDNKECVVVEFEGEDVPYFA